MEKQIQSRTPDDTSVKYATSPKCGSLENAQRLQRQCTGDTQKQRMRERQTDRQTDGGGGKVSVD